MGGGRRSYAECPEAAPVMARLRKLVESEVTEAGGTADGVGYLFS